MHKLIEGKAPIISGVTVSAWAGGRDGCGSLHGAAPVCGLGPRLTSPHAPALCSHLSPTVLPAHGHQQAHGSHKERFTRQVARAGGPRDLVG